MDTEGMQWGGTGDSDAFGLDPASIMATIDEPRQAPPAEGERRLLLAILEDAIRSYQKYAFSGSRRGHRLFREVEAWFGGDPEAGVPFEYVCDIFGIDAGYVRRCLQGWRSRNVLGTRAAAHVAVNLHPDGKAAITLARPCSALQSADATEMRIAAVG
jgi:hypothetical protein